MVGGIETTPKFSHKLHQLLEGEEIPVGNYKCFSMELYLRPHCIIL
jgi:hypothetical protein